MGTIWLYDSNLAVNYGTHSSARQN